MCRLAGTLALVLAASSPSGGSSANGVSARAGGLPACEAANAGLQSQVAQLQAEVTAWQTAYSTCNALAQSCGGSLVMLNTLATARFSCKAILATGASLGSGSYWITAGGAAFPAYCDMTTDGGGWTLAAGIDGANNNHLNSDAVTPAALASGGKGKLADSVVNVLKAGGEPAFRLVCEGFNGYFGPACTFSSTQTASGDCTRESPTYAPLVYSAPEVVEPQVKGFADGNISIWTERLIYADSGLTGCDNPHRHWAGNGALWVR